LIQRALVGFGVHEAEHQDLVARGMLNDGGRQAAHLCEIDFRIHRILLLSKNKKPADLGCVSGPGFLGLLAYLRQSLPPTRCAPDDDGGGGDASS